MLEIALAPPMLKNDTCCRRIVVIVTCIGERFKFSKRLLTMVKSRYIGTLDVRDCVRRKVVMRFVIVDRTPGSISRRYD